MGDFCFVLVPDLASKKTSHIFACFVGGHGGGGEGDQITLTVNVFGNFGYEDLYKEFQSSHPNVKIVERGTGSDLSNYTPALTRNLAAGSGAGDVVALEAGIMIQFKEQAQNFVDLGEDGGNDDIHVAYGSGAWSVSDSATVPTQSTVPSSPLVQNA